jgi:hypothetical protein
MNADYTDFFTTEEHPAFVADLPSPCGLREGGSYYGGVGENTEKNLKIAR